VGIHDVSGASVANERPDVMRLLGGEGLDVAASKEAPQLNLPG